jgi:hypothetical protein
VGQGTQARLQGTHRELGTLILDRDGRHVEKGSEATDKGDGAGRGVEGTIHQRNFIDCIKNTSGTSQRRSKAIP